MAPGTGIADDKPIREIAFLLDDPKDGIKKRPGVRADGPRLHRVRQHESARETTLLTLRRQVRPEQEA